MRTDELREAYLAFFESKGCVRRPSDVLVPRWDPSVLFTPAGMNQFKDHFMGRTKLEFTRATTCQKCLRTGDIDNVGRTAYHHTFFEMLGNFSFGDYFKREAILWAWEFCTDKRWLGLDPARLSATVYLDDDEAADIWLKEVKLPPEKLERLDEDENFWPANAPSQGPDGVCGPCSEIYYHTDRGSVEIWNLVFTQFNRVGDPPDNLRPLPSRNIDTGMGLERTAAVLQGVETNFHIDILRPLVEAAAEVCGVTYNPADETGRRVRRIADHVRACSFAIHENVYPGPNKEKYVIKRLLRRAVLDGRQMGVGEPFLYKLVGKVAELMETSYPELGQTVERVANVIQQEESNFLGTIDGGLERIGRIFDQMKRDGHGTVAGTDAAEMYTTYGFPPELFETLAAEHNLTFDWPGYQKEMALHGELSGTGEKTVFKHDPLEAIKKMRHGSQFLGYETTKVEDAEILAIVAGGQLCDQADEIDSAQPITVVLDQTPFYGEMGGQVGDTGEIVGPGFRFEVVTTQVDGAFTLHCGHLREGAIRLGEKVSAQIDASRRQGIRRAHSATHLLHSALRKVLGDHAEQQGSKVDDDWLRFDFTNPQAVKSDELVEIERDANARILESAAVVAKDMPLIEARKTGATMLFGEKYPDVVRVISMGDFSKELCGGTHLDNTAQVGLLKIVSEESVASGTRRIVALTGRKAMEHIRSHEQALHQAAVALRTSPEELPSRVEAMAHEIRDLRKKLSQAAPQQEGPSIDDLKDGSTEVLGVRVVATEIPGARPDAMRHLIDQLRRKAAPVAVLLASCEEEKVTLIAGASRDIVEQGFDCVAWIRAVAKRVGGGGGGRPDMAQAGGKKPGALPQALQAASEEAESLLKKTPKQS